jgi:hypothetical protein
MRVKDLGVVNVNITGGLGVGGLVGSNSGTVTQCYSTGAISGGSRVGGLVGWNYYSGTVAQCYSTGTVRGTDYVGGLVGDNFYGTVTQCFSSGAVKRTGQYSSVGGLVGYNTPKLGRVTGCFWDIQTSGQATSGGGTGRTTAQMQTAKTFLDAGWDFVGETKSGPANIWRILEGKDYPRLGWELIPAN